VVADLKDSSISSRRFSSIGVSSDTSTPIRALILLHVEDLGVEVGRVVDDTRTRSGG
jgi:hypothetical protein